MIPSWVGAMSTGERAVTPCGCQAGEYRQVYGSCVGGTWQIKGLCIRRHINHLFTFYAFTLHRQTRSRHLSAFLFPQRRFTFTRKVNCKKKEITQIVTRSTRHCVPVRCLSVFDIQPYSSAQYVNAYYVYSILLAFTAVLALHYVSVCYFAKSTP